MRITLSTDDFILALAAAKNTAYARPDEDQILAGIYLYTANVETDEGPTDCLVAVGFDGVIAGQIHVPCSGTLPSPILLDAPDKDYLTSMCKRAKTASKKVDKDAIHEVELTISGESASVKTLTNGIPEPHDRSSDLSLLDASEYPASEANDKLAIPGISNVPVDPNSLVKVLGKSSLTTMQKAATTLKTELSVFPSSVNGGPVVMTDGQRWRAVTSSSPYEGDTDGAPDIAPIPVPEGKAPAESVHTWPSEAAPTDDIIDGDE